MTSLDFLLRKSRSHAISMITCYDAALARLISESDIDCILVGDSCAMTVHGHSTTLGATVSMIAAHTRAVRSGAADTFIIADMPFLSCRKGLSYAVKAAGELIIAGANAVKIEGIQGSQDVISHLVESGIPVMGHVGLTPQFFHALGGWRKQGRTEESAQRLLREAHMFEDAGAFAVVFECVPSDVASKAARELRIPVIGIGAGTDVDGQVLVINDLLGLTPSAPSFAPQYADGSSMVKNALNSFACDVRGKLPVGTGASVSSGAAV